MLGWSEINVRTEDLLGAISADDAIEHFGVQELLDRIGVEEAKEYFGLTEGE